MLWQIKILASDKSRCDVNLSGYTFFCGRQKNPLWSQSFGSMNQSIIPLQPERLIICYCEFTLLLVDFAGWRVILFQSTSSHHHLYLSSELIPNQNERWITPRTPPCSQLLSSMVNSIDWLSFSIDLEMQLFGANLGIFTHQIYQCSYSNIVSVPVIPRTFKQTHNQSKVNRVIYGHRRY